MKLYQYIVIFLLLVTGQLHAQFSTVYVSSGSVHHIENDQSLGTNYKTYRDSPQGYFSARGTARYLNASDAQNINGYMRHIPTAANQAYIFEVGSGTDLRRLSVSGTRTAGATIGTAWIVGDPTSTPDPTNTNALHTVSSVTGPILAVSPAGQWDWIDETNAAGGVTVTVSMPDMTSFAAQDRLRLVGWNGTAWIDLSGTATATGVAENSELTGTIPTGVTIQAIGIGRIEDANPEISLVKTGVLSADGDTITYTFTVTNTGNTTLTGVTVSDPMLGGAVSVSPATLAPNATASGTATYTVTQADRDAGKVTNTATGTAKDPDGNDVTDTSGTAIDNDDETEVPLASDPSIALVKTAVLSADGNTITYTFTVTNTGNITLTGVTVNDPMLGGAVSVSPATLAPNATASGTATYTVTQADRDAGKVTNTATGTAKDPDGNDVTDTSGTAIDNDDETEVPIQCLPDLNPAISVIPLNGIRGQVSMGVNIEIRELLGCDTDDSEIRISVPKLPYFSMNWSTYATASSIPSFGYTGLENSDWTFSETPIAYVWIYNKPVFNANSISNLAFVGTWDAGNRAGTSVFTVTIRNGSGGEVNIDNNVDSEIITYNLPNP